MSDVCQGKSSWPELVGKNGYEAKKIIEEQNPLVVAIIIAQDAVVPLDFRCDRVWVRVDEEGNVTSVPSIG